MFAAFFLDRGRGLSSRDLPGKLKTERERSMGQLIKLFVITYGACEILRQRNQRIYVVIIVQIMCVC